MQMLPLGLGMSASHHSVTASRQRVMRSTAESQSAAHREAETEILTLCIMFNVSQQIVFHQGRCNMGSSSADEDGRPSCDKICSSWGFDL